MHFKINLTLIAVLIIVLFFNIPFYNNWLNTNILNPALSIPSLSKTMDTEQRRISRFGYSYMIFKEVSDVIKKSPLKDPLLLLPPDQYLKDNKVTNISIIEPAIFYYFTGTKAVWYNSPNVAKANCALIPDGNGKVILSTINNQEELDALIAKYKKYKID